ncbi:B12-binding domain-containing protein [Carboxydocella sp. JDF658]|uniref:cobalamin B12-binding domain-containing protein n=1 Tax=Carboxydocella sp. JDF658 TaxID=1926600 RepID=UPI0009AEA12F|nr:cobalamin-dependent protein [Carboxydocella sp. JDF658]GAW31019.1 cobalamin-binding protein [Carboxydocella sp. JDF658]
MTELQALTQAIGDLDEDQVMKILKEFVASNPSQEEAQKVVNACQQGMAIVGDLFEKNEYFVGDLIFAGELLTAAIDILKPVLGGGKTAKIGSMVLATVEGDLHDIGKNIFKSMAEAAGFEVYDLGIDTPASLFVEKVKEVKPQIVGMSGVLTLAIDSMKKTVDALTEAGLRDQVKVIIGGNPVTEDACRMVGADAYTNNAAEGVKIIQGWVK